MGMTDHQFNAYQKMLLRRLELAQENNNAVEEVRRLIEDLREGLQK